MNELDCAELVELVTAYLEGALEPVDEARVVAHLAACDGCSAYVDQMGFVLGQLRGTDPGTLDERRRQQLLLAFREITARRE